VADSPDDLFLQGDNGEIMINGPPRNTQQARSKEDEDNSSIHHTNNNSFNFSNIFNQMKMLDDSNLNNGQIGLAVNVHGAAGEDFIINDSSYNNASDVSPVFSNEK
jgi:hypothetical protein